MESPIYLRILNNLCHILLNQKLTSTQSIVNKNLLEVAEIVLKTLARKTSLNTMVANMANTISSLDFFHINWITWKLLGIYVPPTDDNDPKRQLKRLQYILWAITVHIVATFSSPLHLTLGIFQSTSTSMLFDAFSIAVTSIGATIKTLIFIAKMKRVQEMEAILRQCDARIMQEDEITYYETRVRRNIAQVQNLFVSLYLTVGLAGTMAFVFSDEERLFYPGWVPFDWRHSKWKFAAAITYQLTCIFFQIMQNFTNDSFSPKALCVVSGHIKLLYIRMSKIGYDDETNRSEGRISNQEHERELIRCVNDQMNLYELFNIIKNIISWPMFMQICVSVVNICFAMLALWFFVTGLMGRIYYVFYIVALSMQLFPTCYYGSDIVLLFEELHYAIFSANWIDQSKSFKRHMMISTERSLRKTVALAGGMFPIHLNTFFAACKGAYSLFAVIWTMK